LRVWHDLATFEWMEPLPIGWGSQLFSGKNFKPKGPPKSA
jgi:hypothetical protein